ncbi:Nickel and cobalt resistance protein CnrA [Rosistilla ulvae]|uniref:Nickel and cobalt resistance protein CnrA n=1 Tax=Rosistilla ulvae TaxID=1930277 RepID=A0A517LYU2_9BACT|nr:Nickel and cobalt resistance protein CnrA [Rosistilla ulvae]
MRTARPRRVYDCVAHGTIVANGYAAIFHGLHRKGPQRITASQGAVNWRKDRTKILADAVPAEKHFNGALDDLVAFATRRCGLAVDDRWPESKRAQQVDELHRWRPSGSDRVGAWPPADPVVLRVVGNGLADANELRRIANRVKSIVDAEPDTWDVNDSWGVSGQQLFVDVDSDRASLSGIRTAEVASTLDAYYSGKLLTMYREGDRQIPVYFRLKPESRQSLGAVNSSHIESRVGKISLAAIANVEPQWRLETIDRRDGNRTIEVRSRINYGASGNDITNRVFHCEAMEQVKAELPPGFRIEIGGALEESMKAQGKMFRSFGMSFIAIVLLLIFQFNSLSRTSIIMVTLPLALVGALFGLWVTNNAFGFMPQLGVLALFGIVLNSAILFVEFADIVVEQTSTEKDRPLTRSEYHAAIVDAARQRLMPIFLTTATTVGGLVPLALAGGPLWQGLAWLLIYGLTFATALTLFVIPVLYSFQSPSSRLREANNPIPTPSV